MTQQNTTVPPEARVFDRLPSFDPRSRKFSVRPLLEEPKPRSYTWGCATNLDQGPDGACVGFSWAHEAAAKPVPIGTDYATAFALYKAAQGLDEWPGENYEGTSVIAGAKVAQQYGWLKEYRWAFNTLDGINAISRIGPAIIGINWYDGMSYPDPSGYISPTGSVVGGHAILVRGVSVTLRTVLLHNSWGTGWGGTKWGPGTALLKWDDLDRLLGEQGEMCIPIVRR